MYDLGDQFKIDRSKAISNSECIFKGNKYRITILTERLVRLEYNDRGLFEDNPTERVLYRNFSKPNFTVADNNGLLVITTKYFEIAYFKEKHFDAGKISPGKNLKITLKSTGKFWYYGHPEVRNYGTSTYGVEDKTNKKGLYSIDGFASIDDSNTPIVLENGLLKQRDNIGIDVYVFLYGNDFYYCLNDYFMLTGKPPLIPRYALGNWWSKNEFYNSLGLINLIKKFEDNDISISLLTLNNWQDDNTFEFSKSYTDPKTIINYLNLKNIKFGLTIEDFKMFYKDTLIFNKVKQYLNVDKNGNIPFNLYDARTIDAFLKILIYPLNSLGVSFYSMNTFDKKEIDRQHFLKHYLYCNGLNNKRSLLCMPNTLISSHRYPVLSSSRTNVSWETLTKTPKFILEASNIGVSFFSYDVGGTSGGIEDSELFIRSIQLGVFSPILKLGSDSGKYYKREPWKWSLKPKDISISFLNLRNRLIPYIYTESYKYYKYGKTLIEPLYYRYPDIYDNDLYKDEYFFGSTFLVSPIITKKDYLMNRVIKKFFIPEGTWYEFFSGKLYKGNKKYVSFYKDHEYPVFVKSGAIIPMNAENNNLNFVNKMEILIFPGASNVYSFYEDDGETNNYLNGDYLITNIEFTYREDKYNLVVLPVEGKTSVVPSKRTYKIRFKNTRVCNKVVSYVSNTQVKNNTYRDESDLVVEIYDVPTNEQLTVMCSGEKLQVEAIRIISDEIVSIISDLPIKTTMKQKIDDIMFSDKMDLKKKRIAIRKLGHDKDYLDKKYITLLLKLLEYIDEV